MYLRVEALSHDGGTRGVGCNLCAVFVRADINTEGAGHAGNFGNINDASDGHLGDVRHSMFVHVGKLVELPEGVRRELIPSVVRLQPLDNCLRVWIDAPNSLFPGVRIHSLGAEDGELRVFDELGRGRVAMMSDDEVINEVVESGAEVMETVADDEAKLCRD